MLAPSLRKREPKRTMPLIILHDLHDDEVLVNTENLSAAKRKVPDEKAVIKEAYTKVFYVAKSMDALGFPDTVRETPQEIADIAAKVYK